MLLSQCIWKFHFNCFCTPVVHGLRQLLPCILFSVLVIYHIIPCAILPLESWSWPSELTWRKSILCMKWWPQSLPLLLFHLSVAWLLSPLLWKFEKWLQHELKLPADEKTVKYETVGKDSWTCHPAEVAGSEECQGINAKKLQDQWLEGIFKIAHRSTQAGERIGVKCRLLLKQM